MYLLYYKDKKRQRREKGGGGKFPPYVLKTKTHLIRTCRGGPKVEQVYWFIHVIKDQIFP